MRDEGRQSSDVCESEVLIERVVVIEKTQSHESSW